MFQEKHHGSVHILCASWHTGLCIMAVLVVGGRGAHALPETATEVLWVGKATLKSHITHRERRAPQQLTCLADACLSQELTGGYTHQALHFAL